MVVRVALIWSVAVALVVACSALEEPAPPIEEGEDAGTAILSVVIEQRDLELLVDEQVALTATVQASGGADEALLWGSSDPALALVSDEGVVTTLAPGEVLISAVSVFDPDQGDAVWVRIDVREPEVLGVSIDQVEPFVALGGVLPLSATVIVLGGASEEVSWSSADDAVATVDAQGVVRGVALGEVRVTAVSEADATTQGSVVVRVLDPLVLQLDTTLIEGTQVVLPLKGLVDAVVDWGDGSVSRVLGGGQLAHAYAADGLYVVRVAGYVARFGDDAGPYQGVASLIGVDSWGALGLSSLSGAFWGASNLETVPAWLPFGVVDVSFMFAGASSFDHAVGGWDVSGVVSMEGMFAGARRFDQSLATWDVANVIEMRSMFAGAATFMGQGIESWDVSNVTDTSEMFLGAVLFDGDIARWDVSKVADMTAMFFDAASFNRDLSDWCVGFIEQEPMDFAEGATAWTMPRPSWGSCPP